MRRACQKVAATHSHSARMHRCCTSKSNHAASSGVLLGDFTTRHFHASRLVFSDNLLGHSPMAQPLPKSYPQSASPPTSRTTPGPVWGTDSNTAGGGVWAQTSAKKEKLNELLTEFNASGVDTVTKGMESLDDAASEQDKLDLEFADGIKMIAKCVDDRTKLGQSLKDNHVAVENTIVSDSTSKAVENVTKQMFRLIDSDSLWERPKFEATMQEAVRILSTGLPPDPNLKKPVAGSLDPSHPLCYLREFVVNSEEKVGNNFDTSDDTLENQVHRLNVLVAQAFSSSTHIYRALLLRATAQTLLESWDVITTVTSGDIDRAAVSKISIPSQRSSVNVHSINKLFEAYNNESCSEWVSSWWALIDHDGDGLIDEGEMNACIDLAMKPVHKALSDLVYMSLEVCPVRTVGLNSNYTDAWFLGGGSNFVNINTTTDKHFNAQENNNKSNLSWRNRRIELKARNELAKTFQGTLKRHFRDQVETAHRLRCIYSWAEKSHQNNKIDSIIVDSRDEWGAASSIVGRKRYVELLPKISYPEFRKEQARHFPHLDKIGEEIATSFKEDLWVLQGKRRQNKELRRDSFFFLLGVSLVDFCIGML